MSLPTVPALDDLYREIILDHYRNPRLRGELPSPPAHRVEGFNPLCGDEVVVYLQLDADGHQVADVRTAGQGCSISQSSASMMAAAVSGRTVEETRALTTAFKALMSIHESTLERDGSGTDAPSPDPELDLGDLAALQGVVRFPVRIRCATLPWNTLVQGLHELAAADSS